MTSNPDSSLSDATPPVAHFYVVSGCSGSGKSTLIAALEERGELVVNEPGRKIVKEQIQSGGDGLPWLNPQRFTELCAEQAMDDFDRHLPLRRRTFFDRSLIDIASAVERHRLPEPEGLEIALRAKRYAPLAFISPPWKDLFRTDAERQHTFGEAVAEYEALVPAYRRYGHEIVFIPQAPVAERVSFVLSTLSSRDRVG